MDGYKWTEWLARACERKEDVAATLTDLARKANEDDEAQLRFDARRIAVAVLPESHVPFAPDFKLSADRTRATFTTRGEDRLHFEVVLVGLVAATRLRYVSPIGIPKPIRSLGDLGRVLDRERFGYARRPETD